ncbi:hypothetical protein A5767_18310 [Rhodococcus sp. 852002-51564_SCH6189132-a]|nr:hypothetical protein A5767_18310 [Rhodococcus sp. 852002-51564_SCH6189132-a]
MPRRDHESFAAAVEDRDWSNWYAWVAPESNSLKHLRTRLRDEFGFPKSEVYAQAYWHDERAMGKERTHEAEPDPAETAPPVPEPETTPARGTWRAQGGGRLLAPLKRTLIAAEVLQAVITLIQLVPFVLLTELARRLLAEAPNSELWSVGFWAIGLTAVGTLLAAALSQWLHLVDARFERDLRHRLLGTLSAIPLGWFTARDSWQVKRVVQNDTLSLHYLVTHAVSDAVAAVVAVLVYLFAVDWRLALVLFLPILVYLVLMTVMMSQSGPRTVQSARWAERMDGEAAAYLDGQPVIRVFGGAAASTFRARLGEYVRFLVDWQRPMAGKKTLIDLATRPATFLLLLTALGTALITAGSMAPATLLLLDEATSALDTENETAVVQALGADPVSRTRVIVAHRLASIRTADRMVFLERGRIAEGGTVDEFLSAGGCFAEFWTQRDLASAWQIGAAASGGRHAWRP